ncbi:MAG: hypothetical protein K6F74_05355 [Prevotella sp.]|nr:hypothetical protein [Prevotella sp.]
MEQSKFYQIKNITEHEYTLVGCDGSVITLPIQDIDKSASAFTIQDAKDGDVLVASDGSIFLFKGTIDCACKHYVALTTDGVIKFNEELEHYWETSVAVHPATKEQRDTLEKAMVDAGYTFDFEKKELRKIEQKPTEDVDLPEFESYLCLMFQKFRTKGMCTNGEIIDYVKEHSQKLRDILVKPAWSEEDERIIDRLCDILYDCHSYGECSLKLNEYSNLYDWLKSLRPQSRWKPTDEHYELEEFAKIVRGNLTGISKAVQKLFEAKYLQLTGNKMYGGFKD